MRQFLILAALVAVTSSTSLEGGLRVTFGGLNTSLIGVNYMFDIPRNVSAAKAANWIETSRPDGPLPSLKLYCYENRTVCTLYEHDTGYVAGLQIAVDTSGITNVPLAWEPQGWTSWTPSDDGKTYWAIQQYFVNEEWLELCTEDRLAARNSSKTLQLDAVWVTGQGQKLFKMSTNTTELEAANFVKQNCYTWMGTHYYLNMSTSMECTAEAMLPWFALVDDGELIGSGVGTYGKVSANPARQWYEHQARANIAYVIRDAPTCLLDLCDDPGIITMHIWYVNNPQKITCS